MISLDKQFIFVHFPKTGGNSLQNNLLRYSADEKVCLGAHQDGQERFGLRNQQHNFVKHSTISDYKDQLPSSLFEKMFVFSTIRNPWERLISYYFSPHRKVDKWDKGKFIKLVGQVKPFEDFVCIKEGEWLVNCLDYLIRFEALNEGYQEIAKRLDLEYEPLVHRNASEREDYKIYYDDELKELIETKFQFEINLGNYSF
jgi:hypothetical protein